MRTPGVAVAVVGAALLAAGCSSGSGGSVKPVSASSPGGVVPSASPSTSHRHHPKPTSTVTVTSTPVAAACGSGQLKLSLGTGQGAAGTIYQPVVFTNVGTSPCTLFGYPGVSFVAASGRQLGQSAKQDPGRRSTVTLAPNGQAYANLRQPNPGNFSHSACHQTTAAKLRAYPPGQTQALYVTDSVQVCTTAQGRTGVSPVAPGAGQ